MRPLLFALPGNEAQTVRLAGELGAEVGRTECRRFPDGETYVRLETPVSGRDVALVCTLDRPDDKLLPLAFLADAVRELGARRVGLVAPYLAYMRQDRRFRDGEAMTSASFARLLSRTVDWLVTVDPHLHRYAALSELYSIPSELVHAAPSVAAWIRRSIPRPLLVGPDVESGQWVRAVAELAGAPAIVLEKLRRGDRDVEVSVPEVGRWRERTPVLVDDIISTARTMIETVGHLRAAGLTPPVCIGVHAVFANDSYETLIAAGAAQVVTCDTIVHPSNRIAVSSALAQAVRRRLGREAVAVPAGTAAVGRV
ncbi:MAG: ribose-phosphate pyrophosphokinase [Brachybacterium paraconglomeratum]|jgi:ribose-phosphate pyrophosphokinase|nr:ribose-phosphate pyrophosphokinase [Brachybacterium paraconglomeratum]